MFSIHGREDSVYQCVAYQRTLEVTVEKQQPSKKSVALHCFYLSFLNNVDASRPVATGQANQVIAWSPELPWGPRQRPVIN